MTPSAGQGEGFAALGRFLKNSPAKNAPGERCEFCARPIEAAHGHLVDLKERRLMCSCRPCYLVLTPQGAALGRFKAVPSRYADLGDGGLSDAQWDSLQIPIGLAFFFYNSSSKSMVGFYPGPAGATESQLPLSVWEDICNAHPLLRSMEPDVEAFLAYQTKRGAAQQSMIVPIDSCYELVGRIRKKWKGFDGGDEAWREIDSFFDGLRARSDPGSARRVS